MGVETISNGQVTVQVDSQGAELVSLKSADDVEYLWQADPEVWDRHAPILFPIVGAVRGGVYRYDGQDYNLPQHGFARDSEFEREEQVGQRLAFKLEPNEATRAVYPFLFTLRVIYKLDGQTLHVTYSVSNGGTEVMPFSIGAHPGFSLSWPEVTNVGDYYLRFDRAMTCTRRKLDENKLLSDREESFLENSDRLDLTENLFVEDAVILPGVLSKNVSLRSDSSSRSVTLAFDDFTDLGLWSKPGAPYICIEPWCGHVDPWNHDGDILTKPGIRLLDPGAEFVCRYSMAIE